MVEAVAHCFSFKQQVLLLLQHENIDMDTEPYKALAQNC